MAFVSFVQGPSDMSLTDRPQLAAETLCTIRFASKNNNALEVYDMIDYLFLFVTEFV
jgi:hypothetical protein